MYGIQNKVYNEISACEALKVIVRASVRSQLPIEYKKTMESFYKVALSLEENSDEECMHCTINTCQCLFLFEEANK